MSRKVSPHSTTSTGTEAIHSNMEVQCHPLLCKLTLHCVRTDSSIVMHQLQICIDIERSELLSKELRSRPNCSCKADRAPSDFLFYLEDFYLEDQHSIDRPGVVPLQLYLETHGRTCCEQVSQLPINTVVSQLRRNAGCVLSVVSALHCLIFAGNKHG